MNAKAYYPMIFLAILSYSATNIAIADGSSLIAKPDKCVSLRRGQLCYQRINLNWSTDISGRYCIRASDRATPLKCWNNATTGKITYSLTSTDNIEFQLVSTPKQTNDTSNTSNTSNNHANAVLSSTTVTIAWVYNTKSRNRTTWRLF